MTPRPDCDDSPLDRRKFESKLQGAWSLVKNKIDILNTANSVFDSAAKSIRHKMRQRSISELALRTMSSTIC